VSSPLDAMRPRPFFLNLFADQVAHRRGGFHPDRASGAVSRWRFPASSNHPDAVAALAGGFPARRGLVTPGFTGLLLFHRLIWALLHHFLAGLRHLGFDLGWGEDRLLARKTAWLRPVRGGRRATALIALWRLP